MAYRIIEAQTGFTLADEGGNLARGTQGQVYVARTREDASEAREYLNQPRQGLTPRRGSHRMKSIFGKF